METTTFNLVPQRCEEILKMATQDLASLKSFLSVLGYEKYPENVNSIINKALDVCESAVIRKRLLYIKLISRQRTFEELKEFFRRVSQ